MSYEFSNGYKIRDQGATYFLTFTTVGWIDIFSRKIYRDILLDSFSFCRNKKDLLVGAYVIMSNHLHTIWTAKNNNLSDIVRDFKTHTSKTIYLEIQCDVESRRHWMNHMFKYYAYSSSNHTNFKLWTNDNRPEEIFSEHFLKQKLNYIHENPVRAGITQFPEEYLYSSALDYSGKPGLIEIDFLF